MPSQAITPRGRRLRYSSSLLDGTRFFLFAPVRQNEGSSRTNLADAPSVTEFISVTSYKGRSAHTNHEPSTIVGHRWAGRRLRRYPSSHTATKKTSPEEAAAVAKISTELVATSGWILTACSGL